MNIFRRPNRDGIRSALIYELRESSGYLQDEGWERTAMIMRMAADEIERMTERERRLQEPIGGERGRK
jgi:hypothetical protein